MNLYVMGGNYYDHETGRHFHALVKSSSGEVYVSTVPDGTLFRHSQHHAHLYELSKNCYFATLVKKTGATVIASSKLVLSEDDRNSVMRRINVQGQNGVHTE